MNTIRFFSQKTKPHGKPEEKGVALLTVLALLSIFALILVGFTYTLRMEEITVQRYATTVNVHEFAEAAIQGVLSQVEKDLDPSKEHIVLGRPQPRYVSLLDPWAVGYAGRVGDNLTYDARSHLVDNRPLPNRRRIVRVYPTPIPLGIDEDPEGDVTGTNLDLTGIRQTTSAAKGDGAPGLKGIDDNLDGNVDDDGQSDMTEDDDEDWQVNEDGYDLRRPDNQGAVPFPPGTGYDADGDSLGVFDENAKININVVGNNYGIGGGFTYNLGLSPAELDLPLFLYNRIVNYRTSSGSNRTFNLKQAEELAMNIVNLRYGSVSDGGKSLRYPGVEKVDDNGNNNPRIVTVKEYSDAYRTSQFDGEPFAVTGDGVDNDEDGLYNEEDERYIGPSTVNTAGSGINGPINSNPEKAEDFRPGNKIDDDGDGYIDEQNEGIDDPSEFSVFNPKGDDRPYSTVDDLLLVGLMRNTQNAAIDPKNEMLPTLFEILRDSTTIYSQSDEISGPLSGKNNEIAKINPNLSANWRASDIWDEGSSKRENRSDFQYSPPVRLEDLLAIQVDNDGDWQSEAEPDVKNGVPNGEDDDGDGFIDETSDDWDGNFYPSGDFDGYGEPDVGSPSVAFNGQDDDGDGERRDEVRQSASQGIVGRLRVLGEDRTRPRDEKDQEIRAGMVVEGDGVDSDGDNLIDDDGDFNHDHLLSYDPEWHVSEDAYGDLSADGYPGIGGDPEQEGEDSAEGDIVKERKLNNDATAKHRTSFADDDGDSFADFYDPQVLGAMYAPELDGVDNDGDGEVDEIGERYIACFDDDEDGRMDEDPPEFQIALNLLDFVDAWAPFKVANDPDVMRALGSNKDDAVLADPVTRRSFDLFTTRQREFAMHPRLLIGIDNRSRKRMDFTEQMRMLLPNPPQTGMSTSYEGVEAIRINEVMAKPVIRLEAEETLEEVTYDPDDRRKPLSIQPSSRFTLVSGNQDDGQKVSGSPNVQGPVDTNWGPIASGAAQGSAANPVPGYMFLPQGFRDTVHTFLPVVNMDILAPAFIFSVTNTQVPAANDPVKVGSQGVEEAVWVFENIPAGLYDVVIYLSPYHQYRPSEEVKYFFSGGSGRQEITFRSDHAYGAVGNFCG